MCLRVLFNNVLLCLITLHPDCIKVWDIRTGKLSSVYRELSPSELTVCVLDTRKRKLFVGDAEGNIFTVNIKNGAKMKKFEKHNKMITDIIHWTSKKSSNNAGNTSSNNINNSNNANNGNYNNSSNSGNKDDDSSDSRRFFY